MLINSSKNWIIQQFHAHLFSPLLYNPMQQVCILWKLANIEDISVSSTFGMHVSMRVSEFLPVCVCKFVSVSGLQMLCLINERRSGPPRRPGEDNILLFCYESSSERNRRNSLKWRRARLNNSAFTINSGPTSSRHLPGPQGLQAHHGNVDNSQYNAFLALWQHERLCEHGYV